MFRNICYTHVCTVLFLCYLSIPIFCCQLIMIGLSGPVLVCTIYNLDFYNEIIKCNATALALFAMYKSSFCSSVLYVNIYLGYFYIQYYNVVFNEEKLEISFNNVFHFFNSLVNCKIVMKSEKVKHKC